MRLFKILGLAGALAASAAFAHEGDDPDAGKGLKPPPFAGEPEQVARDVVRALDKKKPVLYTPGIWALVMLVIRNLPRFVMRKIGF